MTGATLLNRVAGAPISWGVAEVPGWGWQMPAGRVLEEMRGLGLTATELGPPGFLPEDGARLRSCLEAARLTLAAGFLVVRFDGEQTGSALDAVRSTAARLELAGARVLVLAAAAEESGYDRRSRLDEAGWGRLARGLAAARELGGERGLAVAVHPHVGTLIERPEDVARLLELTDAEVCLDTGHLAVAGAEPLEVLAAAGGRVRHVHLKDVDPALAGEVRSGRTPYGTAVGRGLFRPLGQGSVDVAEVVSRLESAGYRGWYVLEQDVMLSAEPERGGGPVEAVSQSLRWIQKLVDRPAPPGGELEVGEEPRDGR